MYLMSEYAPMFFNSSDFLWIGIREFLLPFYTLLNCFSFSLKQRLHTLPIKKLSRETEFSRLYLKSYICLVYILIVFYKFSDKHTITFNYWEHSPIKIIVDFSLFVKVKKAIRSTDQISKGCFEGKARHFNDLWFYDNNDKYYNK